MSKTNGIAPDRATTVREFERKLVTKLLYELAVGETETLGRTDPDVFSSPELRQLAQAMKDGQTYAEILVGPLQHVALQLDTIDDITARSGQLLDVLEDARISREIERAFSHTEREATGIARLKALRTHLDDLEARAGTPPEAVVWTPTPDNRPEETEPLITLNGNQILSVGNLAIVTAMPGSGKSALCEGIAAAAVGPDLDTFGFEVPSGTRVLYVDGERSQMDHWRSADRARRRARVDGWLPDNIRFVLFSLEPRVDRRISMLHRMIDEFDAQLVLVDGLGDFVRDVNDAEEVSDFIFSLTAKAKQRNLGVIGTVHPNPSGDKQKARGHLGSEAMRRAEAVLLLEKNSDGSRTIHTNFSLGKNRNAADTLASSFRWSDEFRMFISCGGPDPFVARRTEQAEQLVARVLATPRTWGDVVQKIMDEEQVSKATAKRRLEAMEKAGLVEKTPGGIWQMTSGGENVFPF